MKNFSVIIPTLQQSNLLWQLVDMYDSHPRVGEILVVNNAERPLRWTSTKVRVLQQSENIYVNPAWNLAASQAVEGYLCFSNDDIDFDSRVIEYAGAVLDEGIYSLLGPAQSTLNGRDRRIRHRFSRGIWKPYGTLMFMDRETFTPIPDGPLIWGGDNWLFWNRESPAAEFTGAAIRTEMGTTSLNYWDHPIRKRDFEWWRAQLEDGVNKRQPWHFRAHSIDWSGRRLAWRVARKLRLVKQRHV